MSDSTASTERDEASVAASEVVVLIPPELSRLPILRATAATLAVSLDFDIDTMADFRMAVDELATMLITRARPDSKVRIELVALRDAVTVRATVVTEDAEPVDEASFGWMVLTTLAESVDAAMDMTAPDAPRLRLSLTVRATQGQQ